MIKGAIFDVDGTILDSMRIWDEAGTRYLKTMGKEAEKNLRDIIFAMTIEECAGYLKKHYGLSGSVEEHTEGILNTVRDFYLYEAPLKEGATEMLEQLAVKDIPMTVATSSNKEHVAAAFERLGIRHYFKEIFSCSDVGAGKTQPLIFNMASDLMGTKPKDTYVFEDGLYAVKTAKKAGYKNIGIYDKSSDGDWEKLKREADFYMNDLKEFNKILSFIF